LPEKDKEKAEINDSDKKTREKISGFLMQLFFQTQNSLISVMAVSWSPSTGPGTEFLGSMAT